MPIPEELQRDLLENYARATSAMQAYVQLHADEKNTDAAQALREAAKQVCAGLTSVSTQAFWEVISGLRDPMQNAQADIRGVLDTVENFLAIEAKVFLESGIPMPAANRLLSDLTFTLKTVPLRTELDIGALQKDINYTAKAICDVVEKIPLSPSWVSLIPWDTTIGMGLSVLSGVVGVVYNAATYHHAGNPLVLGSVAGGFGIVTQFAAFLRRIPRE